MGNSDEAYHQGLKLIQRLGGLERPAVLDLFESVGEAEFGELCVGFIYGTVYHRPGLSVPERQLAVVGALAALGHAPAQLKFHAKAALNAGCTRQQVVEAIVRLGALIGPTATQDALAAVREEFAGIEARATEGEALSPKHRELVRIAACTALGTALPELSASVNRLLEVGGTRQEAVETVLHLAFYAGFPAALNALGVVRDVLAARAAG